MITDSKERRNPLSRAGFDEILQEEIAKLPPDALDIFRACTIGVQQQPCYRSDTHGLEQVFVVAHEGARLLLFDDVEDEFAIGTAEGDGVLRKWNLFGELVFALRNLKADTPALPYRVFVVLDREYGERLSELAGKGPVWVVDNPLNRAEAQKLWAAYPNRSHLDGVTTFKTLDNCSPEETLINELDTIEEHHGIYSADPPYTVLEVIGTAATERIKAELARFSFNRFEASPNGFRAMRPLPNSTPS
jgi:hypothetical protein